MEITLVHETKLKVTLSALDMQALSLDYGRMDYTDPATRKALVSILNRGRAQVGFNPRRAKLLVEVYPHEDGGCVLYFTCLGAANGAGQAGMEPVLFEFENADDLISGACKLFEQYSHRIYKSSLYRLRGRYRLTLYPLDYSDRLSVYFLSEYGEIIGEGDLLAAFTEEHGELLVQDRAIDTLADFFAADTRQATCPPDRSG